MKDGVLKRCGVDRERNEYAIPLAESVERTRAELRRSQYLMTPGEPTEYLVGVGGDYLRPELANFDVVARQNLAATKTLMAGEVGSAVRRVYVLPEDDSVANLSKAEMVHRVTGAVASLDPSEPEVRLGQLKRTKTKAEPAPSQWHW